MYSIRLHVYTRASLTDILARSSRGKARVSDKSADKSARIVVSVRLWQAERGSRRTRRHPREDPRAEVGEAVRVGVRVGPMEFQLNNRL